MRKTILGTLLISATILSGCLVRTGTSAGYTTPPPSGGVVVNSPPPQGGVVVNSPQMGAGVQVVEASCQPNAPEQCNGLDDICNGQIDEGCGYSSGQVQITLAWQVPVDLDLYVTDPSGTTISYSETTSPTGGNLDHDARGNCRPGEPNNTIENIFWNTPTPPHGQYHVQVHYWGDCQTGAPQVPASLSISVGGHVIGTYSVTLAPEQRADVATFNI